MEFINYTAEDIQRSVIQNTLQRGIVIDHKLRFLTNLAQNPVMPTINDMFDLVYNMKVTQRFCQNLKFILYSRLESNCMKSGRCLVIGTLERPLFEQVFGGWGGERSVKVLKKSKAVLDYSVFICYKFAKGHKFLSEMPKKKLLVEEFYPTGRVVREVHHSYQNINVLLDVQTNNVHCEWVQLTDKYDPKKESKDEKESKSQEDSKDEKAGAEDGESININIEVS